MKLQKTIWKNLFRSLVAATFFLVVGNSVDVTAQTAAAAEDTQKTKTKAEITELTKRAKTGDAQACFDLAECYFAGDGVKKDNKQGVKWLKKSAEAGNVKAMAKLGNCYHDGDKVKQDYVQAAQWLEKAAETGNKYEYNLVECYYYGHGIEQNQERALAYAKKDLDNMLIDAVKYGHKEIVELLIKNGADINVKDEKGWSPLAISVFFTNRIVREKISSVLSGGTDKDYEEIAKLLINNGADVNTGKDEDGFTPLVAAVFIGNKDLVELLIKNGADVNAKNNDGDTALMFSIIFCSKKEFLEEMSKDDNKWMLDIFIGKEEIYNEISKLLIDNGADVNTKGSNDYTPLVAAVFIGNKDLVEQIIKADADINAKDKDGFTALLFSMIFSKKDIWEKLSENESNEEDRRISTMLRYLSKGDNEITKLLIKNGANINEKYNNGSTPLICASFIGDKEIVELLIKTKTDINAKDNNGNTSLIESAREGHKEIVKLLIENGADVTAKNDKGETALDIATNNNFKEIQELLKTAANNK